MSVHQPVLRRTRNRWYLSANALYAGATPSIDWSTLIPIGFGTRHQRAYLLKSSKGLLDAMLRLPRQAMQSALSHATILHFFREIRALVRWMVGKGIWRFSSLTASNVIAYLDHSKIKKTGQGGENSPFTMYGKSKILYDMWQCNGRYVAPLRVNPLNFPFDMPQKAKRHLSSWGYLDESEALSLINDAIIWIERFGNYIISVFHRLWSLDLSCVGLRRREKYNRRRAFYENISHEPGMLQLRETLRCDTEPTHFVFKKAKSLCDGACITLLLFLEGIRARELARLDAGCMFEGQDGLRRIKGIAAKKNGMARTWVACDAVGTAIDYMERCYSPAREYGHNSALFITSLTNSLLRPGFRTYRVSYTVIRERLKSFHVSSHRGRPTESNLHPHVARKTFARFVVMRDKSALESLAYHFGHLNIAITDGHYVGSDIELARMLSEENRKDLAAGLTDLITCGNVGGAAGKALVGARRAASQKFRGKRAIQQLVDHLIAQGVQLAPCNWGYCVYSQALSACDGSAYGPNESRRSPDICSTCHNFAVTEHHRPWWELRLEQHDKFLRQVNLPSQTIEWVTMRKKNASRILRALNAVNLQDQVKE